MDVIDRKILAVVQQDASLSVAEIGHRVGLSSTPCWKRFQRLEADGVITRRVSMTAPLADRSRPPRATHPAAQLRGSSGR